MLYLIITTFNCPKPHGYICLSHQYNTKASYTSKEKREKRKYLMHKTKELRRFGNE